jgi:hypothetical protein
MPILLFNICISMLSILLLILVINLLRITNMAIKDRQSRDFIFSQSWLDILWELLIVIGMQILIIILMLFITGLIKMLLVELLILKICIRVIIVFFIIEIIFLLRISYMIIEEMVEIGRREGSTYKELLVLIGMQILIIILMLFIIGIEPIIKMLM